VLVDPTGWASLLKEVPYIAIILALGIALIFIYRSREKDREAKEVLQAEYRENLVTATSALHELTAEYLKQSFADSAQWQDLYKTLEAANKRVELGIDSIMDEFGNHEGRIREFVKDHVSTISKETIDRIDRIHEAVERSLRNHQH
jgi:hypothetical protein